MAQVTVMTQVRVMTIIAEWKLQMQHIAVRKRKLIGLLGEGQRA